MNRKRNNCLYCQNEVKGRIDKKFCDDNCRNNYNNNLNRDSNAFMNRINRILRKNRRILKAQNPTGKTKIKREKLLTAGFNFSYYTNTYKTKNGNVYHFCYDQGYLKISEQDYVLIEKMEYVD